MSFNNVLPWWIVEPVYLNLDTKKWHIHWAGHDFGPYETKEKAEVRLPAIKEAVAKRFKSKDEQGS